MGFRGEMCYTELNLRKIAVYFQPCVVYNKSYSSNEHRKNYKYVYFVIN